MTRFGKNSIKSKHNKKRSWGGWSNQTPETILRAHDRHLIITGMDLISLVLRLRSLNSANLIGGSGRAVHGLWFKQWEKINREFAESLHQQDAIPAYSLSPLMGLPHPHKGSLVVREGDQAWIRIATFTQTLSERMLDEWLTRLPGEIELADLHWKVTGSTLSPADHPWANQASYQEIASRALFNNRPVESWSFEFITPTAFNSNAGSLPFPLPDSLATSWLRRWQAFGPLNLPDDLAQMIRQQVAISAYSLHTTPIRYGERLNIGCVGELSLAALNLSQPYRAAFDALARFAFYCGSGAKTTQGMGMTRMV